MEVYANKPKMEASHVCEYLVWVTYVLSLGHILHLQSLVYM